MHWGSAVKINRSHLEKKKVFESPLFENILQTLGNIEKDRIILVL